MFIIIFDDGDKDLPMNNFSRKNEILKELDSLDLKLIRPMSENDEDRISDIKVKKEALRTELQGLINV